MSEQNITLRHTHQAGTLAEGTSRGDGTGSILKVHRFRWSRNLSAWYLPPQPRHVRQPARHHPHGQRAARGRPRRRGEH